jgi:hypothetical protein
MTEYDKLHNSLLEDGYIEIFSRGPWLYMQNRDTIYCLHKTQGYERRTIQNDGRSPSSVEYFKYPDDVENKL